MMGPDDLAITLNLPRVEHSPARMRSMFLEISDSLARLGIVPNMLAANRPNKSNRYQTYRGMRPRLLKDGFDDVSSFDIRHFPGDLDRDDLSHSTADVAVREDSRWQSYMSQTPPIESRWCLRFSIFPEAAGTTEEKVLTETHRLATLFADDYGYVNWMKRKKRPYMYETGGCLWTGTVDDARNMKSWGCFGCWYPGLLRGIYPINYLNRALLERKVEGKSLEKWILADSKRGTLEPVNGEVWCWKPVIAQIPLMNEPVFRAGLLHWWGFFRTIDSLQQDVPPPAPGEWFKIPKETPAMFKSEWYAGRNPKETA